MFKLIDDGQLALNQVASEARANNAWLKGSFRYKKTDNRYEIDPETHMREPADGAPTIQELLDAMLYESSNAATGALIDAVNSVSGQNQQSFFVKYAKELGVSSLQVTRKPNDTVTPFASHPPNAATAAGYNRLYREILLGKNLHGKPLFRNPKLLSLLQKELHGTFYKDTVFKAIFSCVKDASNKIGQTSTSSSMQVIFAPRR